jgi:hypothetical protein
MAHPGDTPVVLIGGSLIVKHGSKDRTQKWNSKNSSEYHTTLTHPIASIALKKHAHPDNDDDYRADDEDPDTDLQRIDVPSAASWKVDVYAQNTDKRPAISIASARSLDVRLTLENQAGSLWEHSKRRIAYSIDPGRTESGQRNATLAKAVVSFDGNVAGTLNSIDLKSNTPGICRIVFRYPSLP